MSRPVAFFTGWFFWIGNTLACSMYALIFAMTIRAYFFPELGIALVALATTVVFTAVNYRSMKEAIIIITVMNLVELAILIGVALLGFTDIEPANLDPIAPMGWKPFVPAMALIYISYVGFELISNASEEIIEPGKTVPRAILITLGVSTAIYVLVVAVMMSVVNHVELAESDVPFIFFAERVMGGWGRWFGIIATIMASLSAFSVTLGASARILFALGRDGHFPKFFAHLHKKNQIPDVSLFVCAGIVVVFSSSGIVRFVASLSDFGYLMGLGIINYSVIPLHRKLKNLRRPFQSRWFPLIPILGVITTWMFVPALETRSFLLGGALTLVGAAIYLTQPSNRSELRRIPTAFAAETRRLIARLRRKRMRVLIIGGKRQGQNIAQRLLAKDEYRMMFRSAEHQISFVEEDGELCKQLEKRFSTPIFQGDGTKRDLLEQVGVENVDVVVAASEDDGRNVISALQARQLGWGNVVAVVQEPEYVELLEQNGVVSISAPWVTAAMVENQLDHPGLAQLFEFGIGAASVLEQIVPADATVGGKLIRDLEIPKECVIAAVIRDNHFVVPLGNTKIEVDDRVIFIGPAPVIRKACDIFAEVA